MTIYVCLMNTENIPYILLHTLCMFGKTARVEGSNLVIGKHFFSGRDTCLQGLDCRGTC